MSNDLRSWFVTFPNGVIPLVENWGHWIAAQCDETAQQMAESDRRWAAWEARVERRLDHYEDLVQWTVASEHARRDGLQLPSFSEPRVYADDGSDAGPSGS
ncbi:hypothetical protein E3N88_15342 [Mikania micrantha]|uniref:Uncharacterized protein n=1 Tax=Mikania micrantha TaxID=192012 RepID=A0A5N6NVS4_9ASTR|nr:hypothetical protein E3N88_15342 [Mikania micrantha]